MGHTPIVVATLDGHPLAIPRPTLAEALRAASAAAKALGRVIVEVKADGEQIPDDALARPSEELTTVRSLTFISADPKQLVGQTLLDAAAALDDVLGEQQMVSDLVQMGRTEEAIDPLRRVLTTWQAARDVVDRGSALLGINVNTLKLEGLDAEEGFEGSTRSLRENLRALRDAMEAEDWSAVSDVVAYDLDAQAKRWSGLLRALATHVGSRPGGPGE
ncbi:hypothetical protein PHYC_03686 [Phycisphaerales bacterium]|nr:hypothetical protein PHYC_03686 [Phycisphaerales bacterium]